MLLTELASQFNCSKLDIVIIIVTIVTISIVKPIIVRSWTGPCWDYIQVFNIRTSVRAIVVIVAIMYIKKKRTLRRSKQKLTNLLLLPESVILSVSILSNQCEVHNSAKHHFNVWINILILLDHFYDDSSAHSSGEIRQPPDDQNNEMSNRFDRISNSSLYQNCSYIVSTRPQSQIVYIMATTFCGFDQKHGPPYFVNLSFIDTSSLEHQSSIISSSLQ
jgi:hypothetical protein